MTHGVNIPYQIISAGVKHAYVSVIHFNQTHN